MDDSSSTPIEVSSSRSSTVLKGVTILTLSAGAVAAATSSRWASARGQDGVSMKAQMWDDDKYGARPRYVEVSGWWVARHTHCRGFWGLCYESMCCVCGLCIVLVCLLVTR